MPWTLCPALTGCLGVRGTYRPDRAKKKVDPVTEPLPEPPRRIPAAERRLWRELSRQAPHLRVPDQFMFEMLVMLMHQFHTEKPMQSARIGLILKLLTLLYMAPASRVNIPPALDTSEYDEF